MAGGDIDSVGWQGHYKTLLIFHSSINILYQIMYFFFLSENG